MTKSTANTALTYDYNVNGADGFTIDDVSVVYDFTSTSSSLKFNWTPYDSYLIIGDVVGSTENSTSDGILDAYDVNAFIDHFVAVYG